jgi:transposase
MGKAARSTILQLDLSPRACGGANTEKRAALQQTSAILTEARAFFLDFLLTHNEKLTEKLVYYSEKHQELRERLLSAEELRSWLEQCTVSTKAHPHVPAEWDFKARFPGMPAPVRRAAMKEAKGLARAYLTTLTTWQKSGKKKGRPGLPGAADHPTFYQGAFELELEEATIRDRFVRLKVYDGQQWDWMNYPVKCSRHFQRRMREKDWKRLSPTLILRGKGAALHFPQAKEVQAARVVERKLDPHLVTVGVDLNVKNLAVVTVRQDEQIIETVFLTDHGLDQARYQHLKKIAKKQWQTGKPIKGERSNQDLWRHVRHTNEDAAHKVACQIAEMCARYPGCILLFERLRKIRPKGGSKARRMNRRQANQLRGKIRQYAGEKAYARADVVTVEINPHGTSQYCSRCGSKGERFSYRSGKRIKEKWGKLFWCPVCHYEASADFNASANTHHSFYRELHWGWREKRRAKPASPG